MEQENTDPAERLAQVEKLNRTLERRLARLESNVGQMEDMKDQTSKLLSKLMDELAEERAKSHALLLNILPQPIIDRLEAGEEIIADRFPEVTVLLSDFMGFTEISSELDPSILVTELNSLFSEFDLMCERAGVEKIKTIGDAYLAVGGLPGTRDDHASAVADLALGMVESIERRPDRPGRQWKVRIGVHTGPVVAGVIGTRKFVYDVWGDTVNVASRLESTAEPNHIHVSEAFAAQLSGKFEFEPRGTIDLKGKGETQTFLLSGRVPRAAL